MALASYSDLQAAVKSWATRTDSPFTSKVADFIRLGEERIWRRLRVSDMVTLPSTLTILAGLQYVDLPDDWLAFKRISSAAEPRIEFMPPDQLWDLPTPGSATAYSIEGRRLLYGQIPAADLDLTVRYYAHPGNLSDSIATTWLLTKAPSAYLYAALLEAYLWAKNPAKVGEYGKLLDDVLAGLDSQDKAAMISGGALRSAGRW